MEQSERGDPSTATEIELVITDPALPPEEILILIDFVSYRITCPASNLTPVDDSADLAGNFEVNVNANPPIWEMVTNLPLSPSTPPGSACTISLWVFYEDEVVCFGSDAIPIVGDDDPAAPNEVSLVLECNLSVDGPDADLNVDGSFDFINGNYCPKINWLGAVPMVVEATVPPETTLDASAFDVDSTCGLNCDPQLCDFTQIPPVCTPAADPGFSIRFSAPAGKGSFNPSPPVLTGTPMTGGTPIEGQATYTCDPLYPGPTEICAMASDGDNDCDKMRCITIVCPDLCEGVVCDDGLECTRDLCDPLTGLCSNDPAPVGVACNNCNNTCQANGACNGAPFSADVEFNGTAILSGTQQVYNETLVNPYSGASVSVSGTFRVNDLSYNGIGTADVLSGVMPGGTQSEVLLIKDLIHPQTVCGVETLTSLNGFDVMFLADDFIVLQSMVIEGGTNGDLLWANAGNDTVLGNTGDDVIDGGFGDDMVVGGLGDDTITLWPGSGFDSVSGDLGSGNMSLTDRVEVDAIQSQILITPAADPGYEFDLFFLGTPLAQIREVELLVMDDASIDLTTCTGSPADVCNLCGNDALNGDEGCDDGNNVDGDGCSSTCVMEF